MFRYIFRLQAQDFALAAIPAAVKQDIYLLHEISPEFVSIRVSRIGGVVERRRREVCAVCCSFCSATGAGVTVAAFAVVCSFTLFFPIIVFIILNTPFTEGLKLCCIPCPSVCRSSGLSLSTLQRFANFHPTHGEQNKGVFLLSLCKLQINSEISCRHAPLAGLNYSF